MKGKTIIQKYMHNWFWPYDMKARSAKGKKPVWVQAEGKAANRRARYDKAWTKEIDE